MAIAFRSIATLNYGSHSSPTVLAAPAGIVDGDILIAVINVGNAASGTAIDVTPPAGFTAVAAATQVTEASIPLSVKNHVFWKRAASESGSYSFTHDAGATRSTGGAIAAYSGCIASGSPIDTVSTNSGVGTTATALSVTTTVDFARLVIAGHNFDASTVTSPSGFALRFAQISVLQDGEQALAGASGNKTYFSGNVAGYPWQSWLFGLKPAVSGGGGGGGEGSVKVWNGSAWVGTDIGLTDAPSDGLTYGRKNATWATIGDFATLAYVDARVEWFSSASDGVTATGAYVKASDGARVAQYGSTYSYVMGATLNIRPRTEDTFSTATRINFRDAPGTIRGYIQAELVGAAGIVSIGSRDSAGVTDGFLQLTPTGIDVNNKKVYNVATPTVATDAANKSYVDSRDALYLPLTGGTLSNDLTVNGILKANGNTFYVTDNTLGHGVFGHTSASGSGTVACCIATAAGQFTSRKAGTGTQTHFATINSVATGGVQVGRIESSGTTSSYIGTSDELLKTFTGRLDPQRAIDIIRADPAREWDWNDGSGHAVGWGAQTSHAISPDLANPPPPYEPNEDDDPELLKIEPKAGEPGYIPWGMDQSKRTPYLWAALSAALDRIDQLEARLAALEVTRKGD